MQLRKLGFESLDARTMFAVSSLVVPTIGISDATVLEGDTGAKSLLFNVSLSSATTRTVSVGVKTTDFSAKSGADYSAINMRISFAPGETLKSVAIPVWGDLLVENTETFTVALSEVKNASYRDRQGVGSITDNDTKTTTPQAPVEISISNAAKAEGSISALSPYFHTSGNQIVDSSGKPVRIAGVNWYGFETNDFVPEGLWARNYKDMMNQMKSLGFNTIRLPYSNQLFDAASKPVGINYTLNPDLVGLSGVQLLDKIVDYAGQNGLKIILDHHRSSAGGDANENGLWSNAAYPESRWISDWQMLARRYANSPAVIGVDLHNEPHGAATWGTGGANDWRLAAERAGNAVLAAAPNWLIIVEGVETTSVGSNWWGGNLSNAAQYPVRLNVANRLVYSAHDYGQSLYNLDRFNAPNYPNNLPAEWDKYWGYLFKQNIAPVMLGEFGSNLATTNDQLWMNKLISYLQGDFDGNGTSDLAAGQLGMSWSYWCWNPNWGNTGGIMQGTWSTVNQNLVNLLKPMEFVMPVAGSASSANSISFAVSLSQASTTPVYVTYATASGVAVSGQDFTATSGTLTFNPGETIKLVNVFLIADNTVESSESFTLNLSNPVNATLKTSVGSGIIVNDD